MSNNKYRITPSQARLTISMHVETKSGEAWISLHEGLEDAMSELEAIVEEWGFEAFETVHFNSMPVSAVTAESDTPTAGGLSAAELAALSGLTLEDMEEALHGLMGLGLVEQID